MSRIVEIVSDIIEPIIEEQGYDLVDVEFLKEGPDWFLRVYIDQEKGIDVDDCAKLSRVIGSKLDEVDPIAQEYYLEVSSPGIERVLKKDKDFLRFKGSKVKVKLFTKFLEQKQFAGELVGADEKELTIIADEEIKIPRELISRVNILWEE